MKTEVIAGHKVELYDSIDELPIVRYNKYNKLMLIETGVGSDLNDINSHVNKIKGFMNKSDNKSAFIELDNLRQNLYFISQSMSPKYLAFAVLVKSIDGVIQFDLSEESLKKIIDVLSSAKKSYFDRIVNHLKKNFDKELDLYFSDQFSDGRIKEYYDQIKKRIVIQMKAIRTGIHDEATINKIDDFLLTFFKPNIFTGKNSMEIKYGKDFGELCIFVSKNTNSPIDVIKQLTVLEFYNALSYVKKELKEAKKQNKKRKRRGR